MPSFGSRELNHLLMQAAEAAQNAKQGLLPEAVIMRLHEAAALIAEPNQFKVGDLVTVRNGFDARGVGDPAIVVGVNEDGFDAGLFSSGECGTSEVSNIMIAGIASDGQSIVTMAHPHWKLERYTGPGADQ